MIYGLQEVKKMYRLKIELKSDLCVTSGDGYATVVDTDIVTDNFGIPYIPARRLKGCLREIAGYINAEHINDIFGVSGSADSGSLRISNAVIESYDELLNEVRKFSPQAVTELFTNTIASTAITEEGAVKDNSLRFMRAIDRVLIWDNSRNTTFYSDVIIDEEYVPEFERICKALRHIGYKRARGFGAVKCSLENTAKNIQYEFKLPEDIDPNKEYILEYALKLDDNMMCSGTSSDKTMDYISGQAVLGMFAGEYLKNNPADNIFDSLFLTGKVRFSNLYITDDSLSEYIPVPMVLGKVKGGDGSIIDMTDESATKDKIVKPVKNSYISGNMKPVTVDTEIVYHNSLCNDESHIYTQLCLQKGQKFRGSITADGKSISVIAGLLAGMERISLGRSKTAQYSGCTMISAEISEVYNEKFYAEKNDTLLYVFESDAIISDKYGNISPTIELAKEALGITGEISPASVLKYRTIKGFLSVMRLQKSHIRAIAAGSVIAVKCEKSTYIDRIINIGEKQNEGFGRVRVFVSSKISEGFRKCLFAGYGISYVKSGKIHNMLERLEKQEQMRKSAVEYVRESKGKFKDWNTSFIGRIALMTEEANDRKNLDKRIRGIKSKTRRVAAEDLLKHSESNHYKDWNDEKEYILLILRVVRYIVKQGKGQLK